MNLKALNDDEKKMFLEIKHNKLNFNFLHVASYYDNRSMVEYFIKNKSKILIDCNK